MDFKIDKRKVIKIPILKMDEIGSTFKVENWHYFFLSEAGLRYTTTAKCFKTKKWNHHFKIVVADKYFLAKIKYGL